MSGAGDDTDVELEIIERITTPVFKDICLSGNADDNAIASGHVTYDTHEQGITSLRCVRWRSML